MVNMIMSYGVGIVGGFFTICIGIILIDRNARQTISRYIRAIYLKFLGRLVINIIRKHFPEGLHSHISSVTWHEWRWTEAFEDTVFNQYKKRSS